jgi:hypothetical protein
MCSRGLRVSCVPLDTNFGLLSVGLPRVFLDSPPKVTGSFGPGQSHVARARRALKGPGYAYKAG